VETPPSAEASEHPFNPLSLSGVCGRLVWTNRHELAWGFSAGFRLDDLRSSHVDTDPRGQMSAMRPAVLRQRSRLLANDYQVPPLWTVKVCRCGGASEIQRRESISEIGILRQPSFGDNLGGYRFIPPKQTATIPGRKKHTKSCTLTAAKRVAMLPSAYQSPESHAFHAPPFETQRSHLGDPPPWPLPPHTR
jgi:hypothetical protein